jgi:hypothetical protein
MRRKEFLLERRAKPSLAADTQVKALNDRVLPDPDWMRTAMDDVPSSPIESSRNENAAAARGY